MQLPIGNGSSKNRLSRALQASQAQKALLLQEQSSNNQWTNSQAAKAQDPNRWHPQSISFKRDQTMGTRLALTCHKRGSKTPWRRTSRSWTLHSPVVQDLMGRQIPKEHHQAEISKSLIRSQSPVIKWLKKIQGRRRTRITDKASLWRPHW